MGNKKRLLINMVTQVTAFILNVLINFFLTRLIVNRLGKEMYGFVGLANNFASYISVLTVAINGMLNRYVTISLSNHNDKKASEYFTSVTFFNIASSALFLIPSVILCMNIEYFINVPEQYVSSVNWLWVIIFFAFLITLATSSFSVSTFAVNRLDLASKRQMESYVIKAGILLTLFSLFNPRIWYIGVATLVSAIYIGIVNIFYTRSLTPQLRLDPRFFSWIAVKELVSVGIWNSINQLSLMLITGLDLLIANLYIGPEGMGILSIAKTIPIQLQAFYVVVSNVFAPKMTVFYGKGDIRGFIKETKFAMCVCGYICALPMVGFVVYGVDFFRLWVTTLNPSQISEVQILSILTIMVALVSVFIYPIYSVNSITTKLKIPVLVSFFTGILNVIVVVIVLKTTDFGIYAIAGVSSILIILRVVFFAPIYAAHSLSVNWWTFYSPLIKGMISLVVMLVIFNIIKMFVPSHTWIMLGISAVICAIVGYIINFFIIFERNDRQRLLSAIFEKLH